MTRNGKIARLLELRTPVKPTKGSTAGRAAASAEAEVSPCRQILCKWFNMNGLHNNQCLARSKSVKVGQTDLIVFFFITLAFSLQPFL
jgi:hypothetical protein